MPVDMCIPFLEINKAMQGDVDVTGSTFGEYVVLRAVGVRVYNGGRQKVEIWAARCSTCNKTCYVPKNRVLSATFGCNSCAYGRMKGNLSPHWTGGRQVPGFFIAKAKKTLVRASKTIKWTLTIDELDSLWESQEGRCAYSGLTLQFGQSGREQTASLDRIDSSGDYSVENVQFVHKDINAMKWKLSEERFLQLCKLITEREKDESSK